jgi:hypothetical protein
MSGSKRLKADTVALEWEVDASAKVLDCELQYREKQSSGFVSWKTALVDASAKTSTENELVDKWKFKLAGLRTSTNYVARVKARNAHGWSAGFSDPVLFRSPDVPKAPTSVVCAERGPRRLLLVVTVENPEGAPVTGLFVERGTMVSFEPMRTDASAAPRVAGCTLRKNPPVGEAVLEVVLDELTAEQMYSFRIWAVNPVGKGSTAAMCSFATAGRPGLPRDLGVLGRGVNSLDLSWRTCVEDEVEADSCEVQHAEDTTFATWTTVSVPRDSYATEEDGAKRWRLQRLVSHEIRTNFGHCNARTGRSR